MGFMEGTREGLRDHVVYKMQHQFGVIVKPEDVKIVVDRLPEPAPERLCWSIHMEYDGQHYESVIRNMRYDSGEEDW